VGRDVLVSLLVALIFGYVMEVVAADNKSSVHLCGDDSASQDTAADGNEAGEGAFFVCGWVGGVSLVGRLEGIELSWSGLDFGGEEVDEPIYVPSMAFLGVLKPNPTSLYHLLPPFPTLRFAGRVLLARKMWGCFWKARSD
jgi:hypothetical protein